MIRGWDPILPCYLWLHEPQPINNQAMGLGFWHRAGRCRPGGSPVSPRFVELEDVWKEFLFGDGNTISPGVLASRTPTYKQSANVR